MRWYDEDGKGINSHSQLGKIGEEAILSAMFALEWRLEREREPSMDKHTSSRAFSDSKQFNNRRDR